MEEELGATINDGGQQSGSGKSDSSQSDGRRRKDHAREGERERGRVREGEVSRVQLVVWTGGGTCAGMCVGEGQQ